MKSDEINFGKALKECRVELGLSQEELALESNLDRTYISMLERGIKVPTLTTVNQVAKAMHMSPSSLVAMAEINELPKELRAQFKKERVKFPFMGTSASCGLPIAANYKIEEEISINDFLIKNLQKTFFVKASGDSMSPLIQEGDLLAIELSSKVKNRDIVLAQVGSEFTIKRYLKSKNGITLAPDNKHFGEVIYGSKTPISICGIVIGLVRKI